MSQKILQPLRQLKFPMYVQTKHILMFYQKCTCCIQNKCSKSCSHFGVFKQKESISTTRQIGATTQKDSLSITSESPTTLVRDSGKKLTQSYSPSLPPQQQQQQQQPASLILVTDILRRVPDLTFMLSEELYLP
jgi:hypothetical protein